MSSSSPSVIRLMSIRYYFITDLHLPPVDTIQELNSTIQSAVQSMRMTEQPITAVVSACELFSRFITLARFDDKSMDECKTILVNRGEIFLNKLMQARPIIAQKAAQFITDDCVGLPRKFYEIAQ